MIKVAAIIWYHLPDEASECEYLLAGQHACAGHLEDDLKREIGVVSEETEATDIEEKEVVQPAQ